MSKFLEICENSDPENKHPEFYAKFFLKDQDVKGWKSEGKSIFFNTDKGVIELEVKGFVEDKEQAVQGEEDAESVSVGFGDINVDTEVKNMAAQAQSGMKGVLGKMFGSDYQKAAAAVKKRARLNKQMVGTFDQATNRLEKTLAKAQKSLAQLKY